MQLVMCQSARVAGACNATGHIVPCMMLVQPANVAVFLHNHDRSSASQAIANIKRSRPYDSAYICTQKRNGRASEGCSEHQGIGHRVVLFLSALFLPTKVFSAPCVNPSPRASPFFMWRAEFRVNALEATYRGKHAAWTSRPASGPKQVKRREL